MNEVIDPIIEFWIKNGLFHVTELSLEEMDKITPWHPIRKSVFVKIKESIRNEVQKTPIIVSKDLVVVDGHDRLRACKELGIRVKAIMLPYTNEFLELNIVSALSIASQPNNLYGLLIEQLTRLYPDPDIIGFDDVGNLYKETES